MEGCSKTSAGAAFSSLPDGPLAEILSRVPAKSLCRFKCVSKGWRDLIAHHPDIRKKLMPQSMQGLFVQTLEVDDELNRVSFSFVDLAVRRSVVPLDIDPSFSFLTGMTGIKTLFFLHSCNGLVLFGHRLEPDHLSAGAYMVCNPTTQQWLDVPACGSREAISHAYLVFDPAVSSHFHLVQIQVQMLDEDVPSWFVYSSETGTWSENQIDEHNGQGQFLIGVLDYPCAFVNGFLHLVVWGLVKGILVVDIQGKARRRITVPGMADGSQMDNNIPYLGQSQGHLHCVTIESAGENNDKLSTWVLQDYDTQEWVLKRTVNSLDVFGEKVVRPEYEVVDIHQDSNVLFFLNKLTRQLIGYDMDRKEASVLATFQDYKFWGDFARYVPYFLESPALTNKH